MYLYLPPECFRSSPASEASTSGSNSRAELERWRTSRQILSALPCLLLEWQTEPWAKVLSGLTSAPSTVDAGAAWWMRSLAGVPAKISRSPALEQVLKASEAGSGKSSDESSKSPSRRGSGGRTSAGPSKPPSRWSRETLKPSASELSAALSALQTSAPPTSASESSCWPTPSATPYGSSQNGSNSSRPSAGTPSLWTHAATWPTPTAMDARASGSRCKGEDTKGHPGTTLTDAAVQAFEHTSGRPDETTPDGQPSMGLNPEFVESLLGLPLRWSVPRCGSMLWGTPSSPNKPLQRSLFAGEDSSEGE